MLVAEIAASQRLQYFILVVVQDFFESCSLLFLVLTPRVVLPAQFLRRYYLARSTHSDLQLFLQDLLLDHIHQQVVFGG